MSLGRITLVWVDILVVCCPVELSRNISGSRGWFWGVGAQHSPYLAWFLVAVCFRVAELWNSWQDCWSEISLGPDCFALRRVGAVSEEQWRVVLGFCSDYRLLVWVTVEG